jgi:hypothetical protein
MYTQPHTTTDKPCKISVHYRRPQFSGSSIHDLRTDLYRAAAAHYANALHLDGSVAVVVRFSKTKISNDHHGYCEANTDAKGRWVVTLHRDAPIWTNLETLAHEFVHVRQFVRGKLRADGMALIWNNETGLDALPWSERPWEVEANNLDKLLRKDFAECLTATARNYARWK